MKMIQEISKSGRDEVEKKWNFFKPGPATEKQVVDKISELQESLFQSEDTPTWVLAAVYQHLCAAIRTVREKERRKHA